ncbi:uracil-DNA glycosylase family protein [Endozoicomonas numazuensis]|uniref:Uracil-DNA glycosylase-like domain-containing protein n=1 Tax=Endozoicomonas numazuensis TaxID=1137799 RepID=A0A081NK88_9GAMM|nr:hypothetical protein [Endozoicomonas numazuensis]KEQ18861.1 hypothetical protein GZ78_02005 [Endozoicomonas numazuensis]
MQGRINERTRQHYLDAMGIQTWFPRQILPNALPPREFDFPEEEFEPETPSALSGTLESVQTSEAAMGVSTAKDLLGISNTVKTKPEAKPDAPVINKLVTETRLVEVSKFRLVTLPANEHCLVVAEMPHSGLNQFSRFHQRLLSDILRAIKMPAESDPLPSSEFIWPLGNIGLMEHLSQDDSAAADAVCAYLSNQFGLARRKVVLLFGQAAARFVIDPNRSFGDLRGLQKGLHSDQHFVVTHGLNELMKLPALKSEAWQDISPIIKELTLS